MRWTQSQKKLLYRSEFLLDVFKDWVDTKDSVLEIGCGDGRNIKYLNSHGFHAEGIDVLQGTPIETVDPKQYDVIFTMSTLFLIPPENNWVFEKIAKMAKKYIITIEGETTASNNVWGRDYSDVFKPFGFREVYSQSNIFNEYGVLRVLHNERNY